MSILLNNKLLKAAEAKLESTLTPENKTDYLKIVVAGQRFALHNGRGGLLASLKGRPDPVRDCVRGAVNIVAHLKLMSRGTMPVRAMVPAALSLMLQGLDFVDKANIKSIGRDELARATRMFIDDITKMLGVTPQMLQQAAALAQGVMNDPAKMELVKRRAGIVRDPRAGVPNDLSAFAAPPPNRRARRAAARGRK